MLDGAGSWDGGKDVHIFVSNDASISKTTAPTPGCPIVQSYVDICVNGYLDIETLYRTVQGFARDFIATTAGWNSHLVIDRIYPRRPFIYVPNASDTDRTPTEGHVLQYVQLHDTS
jgi:hypothetical protein